MMVEMEMTQMDVQISVKLLRVIIVLESLLYVMSGVEMD